MKRSGIITLLTDFGLIDPYIAMMKGVILSINIDARIVDITHSINTGSIFQAAHILAETFKYFPAGSIHVAVIDPGVGSNRKPIALETENHFFIGPDNGIFSLIIDRHTPSRIIEITEEKFFLPHVTKTFHGREVFAPVAAHVSMGTELDHLGPALNNPIKINFPEPYQKDGILYGRIIRTDNFGNLITNITNKDFDDFMKKSRPEIHIGGIKLKELNATYSDVKKGELLALINSSGLLEIALNLGRASDYPGMEAAETEGFEVKICKRD
jgi:S-adenosylmethionine hydrolase